VQWPLGCLALVLIHAVTGGRWGWAIRPELLLGISVLPLLLPAIVPLLFVLPHLYPWLRPEEAAHLPNRFYLNMPFAAGRGVFYLIVWFGLGALAMFMERRRAIPAGLAAVGLILLGLTVTFASVDATMSLEPHFKSSNYGMIAGAEAGLLAMSVCLLRASIMADMPSEIRNDLGRLMLMLLVLWAYLDFMQLLIIWQSNLPHEVEWYTSRLRGGWGAIAAIVAGLHFLLPLLALFSPTLRKSPRGIGAVAALLVAMEALRVWWLVLSARDHGFSWVDVAAMLALGGITVGLVLRTPRPVVSLP
jgi:hypothetical protein